MIFDACNFILMVIAINRLKLKIGWSKAIYVLIILAYLLYLARDLNYNTAFVDEAIYATVGEEVLRGLYWENALSWMGGSYVYPVISALINRELGLIGVRLFSALCLLFAGIIVGKIGRQLGGTKTQLTSMALFLFSANTLDLGQLGTYDAPSMAFVSASVYLALTARYTKGVKRLLTITLSAVLISLAIVIKYVALLFAPVIALLIFYKKGKIDFLSTLFWGTLVYLFIGYYAYTNTEVLFDFFTGSYFDEPATRLSISKEVFKYLYVLTITAPISLFYILKKLNHEKKTIAITFFLAGLIPLTYHYGFSNIRSIWKHLVYTSLFWSPLSAWFLIKVYNYAICQHQRRTALNNFAQFSLTLAVIAIVSGLWFNFGNHWRFQRSWPSATKSIEYLEANRKPDDKIFAEASAVYKYHMFTGFETPESWSSTWWVQYEDKQGTDAMKAAIWDKEYDYVILNGYFTKWVNDEIYWDLTQNYELVLEDDYKVFGKYQFTTNIWRPMQEKVALSD